jgi:hypothetical protein
MEFVISCVGTVSGNNEYLYPVTNSQIEEAEKYIMQDPGIPDSFKIFADEVLKGSPMTLDIDICRARLIKLIAEMNRLQHIPV